MSRLTVSRNRHSINAKQMWMPILKAILGVQVIYKAKTPDRVERYGGVSVPDNERPYWDLLFAVFRLGVIGDPDDPVVPSDTDHNQTTLMLLFIFTVVVISICMLNMLIAIMTSIFEAAEDQAEAKMYRCRARLILEYEAAMGMSDVTEQEWREYFPAYLHVIRPLSQQRLTEIFAEAGGGGEGLAKVLQLHVNVTPPFGGAH
jgi:hypothetical protein